MKAAVRKSYGGIEKIEIIDLPIPTPRKNEVLVKVKCTTVNRTDQGVLTGLPFVFRFFIGLRGPKRKILGTDFSGVVEACGSEVSKFKVGDRVWGFYDEGLQSQAEYMVIGEDENIVHMPENVSFERVVACAEGAHYALNCLRVIPYKNGDEFIVNGTTGAIGSA